MPRDRTSLSTDFDVWLHGDGLCRIRSWTLTNGNLSFKWQILKIRKNSIYNKYLQSHFLHL